MPSGTERSDFYWMDGQRGSVEHYWHFMFGYFLPMLGTLRRGHFTQAGLFPCGPMMEPILVSALERLGVRPVFDPSFTVKAARTAWVKRMDDEGGQSGYHGTHALDSDGAALGVDRWDLWLYEGQRNAALRSLLIEARDIATDLLAPTACCNAHAAEGKLLILRRAPEPDFYRPGGPAKVAGYGAGRRVMTGIDEGAAALEKRGVASLVYEPGAHTIGCQIEHFRRCAGVVGVRGAEFGNILWVPENAKIVMFMSTTINNDYPPPRALAKLLGQAYVEIPHGGEANPTLDIDLITDHL